MGGLCSLCWDSNEDNNNEVIEKLLKPEDKNWHPVAVQPSEATPMKRLELKPASAEKKKAPLPPPVATVESSSVVVDEELKSEETTTDEGAFTTTTTPLSPLSDDNSEADNVLSPRTKLSKSQKKRARKARAKKMAQDLQK